MQAIFIGFDPREAQAFAVARFSIRRRLTQAIPILGLVLDDLRREGLYWRKHERRGNQTFDVISGAPMATEFAISRFLVPTIAKTGWALFLDADMLVLSNLARLFEYAQTQADKAVLCVKHKHVPPNEIKMDGQLQTLYPRKNWSSLMMFNCDHPANAVLTPDYVNTLPGRDLHRFCWLRDDEIGDLDASWNWLVGHSDETIEPKVVHFTSGGPWFDEYTDVPYAKHWQRELVEWARR